MEDEPSAVEWPIDDLTVGGIQSFLEGYEGPYDNLVVAVASRCDGGPVTEGYVEQIRLYWGADIMDDYGNDDPEAILYADEYSKRDWEWLLITTGQDRYQATSAWQKYYDTKRGDTLSRVLFDEEGKRAELVHVFLIADEYAPFGASWFADCHAIADGCISYLDGACYWGPHSTEEMIAEVAGIAGEHYADLDEGDCCHLEALGTHPRANDVADANGRIWVVFDERAQGILRNAADRAGIDETTAAKITGRDGGRKAHPEASLKTRVDAAKDVSIAASQTMTVPFGSFYPFRKTR
jgi:hypothetical protein